jgi:HD-GYP domain-containing protein (c-di-GMP phosphodiesterase class II)
VLVGSARGLEPRVVRLLGEAALLRYIGKTRVPVDVLRDRDRDPGARREYELHPLVGAKLLLERWEIDPIAAIVAYEHHACLDLKGFPRLGARKSMHAFSRIVAVASDYDRMTGGYPGCPVRTVWEAVAELVKGVGSTYDPAAVRGLLHLTGTLPEGTPVKLVDGREGIVAGGAGTALKSWLYPNVVVLRDATGAEVGPEVVSTDGVVTPGEPVVKGFLQLTERDLQRIEALSLA